MRYFLRDGAFFIRGAFTTLMSGQNDTAGRDDRITPISTVIAAHLPHANTKVDTHSFFQILRSKNGYGDDACFLPVTTSIDQLRIFAYDGIIVFIHSQPSVPDERPGPVTIIVTSREPLPEEGLNALQDTAKEALHQASISAGFPVNDPGTNTILICCEEMEESPDVHERMTRAQMLVSETIAYGIRETWAPHETGSGRNPPFYIHSSIGGERWTRWNPEGCPYYPCHPSCKNQRCDFCYCPLYPCGDESVGKWLKRENGGRIWSCEGCTLVHEPAAADYLTLHPEASVEELRDIQKMKNSE